MQLAVLPDAYEPLVLVGTSVRKSAAVLRPYLEALAWQELPARVKLHYAFVDDGCERDARTLLDEFVATHGGEILRGVPAGVGDFTDTHPQTHQWSAPAMRRVGANKNRLLSRALELRADAVWLVDADLICDCTTLAALWAAEKPIACAVYWTHWHKGGHETRALHSAPQVWLRHPYSLDGRGYAEHEFRARLVARQLTRVWGQGACSLIRTSVVQAGITFQPFDEPHLNVGLMAGEDRHFCIRAERLHCEMWADPFPDIYHIYHLPDDLARVEEMRARLGAPHPEHAAFGDLVSLRLDAVEPFPQPNNQWYRVPPQFVRGRLGALPLLPELEEAVHELARGQDKIVPVHVPYHYPVPYMQGKRRLVRVHLIDCKPFGFAPVVEDELIVGTRSRAVVDSTTISERQGAGIRELSQHGTKEATAPAL